MRTYHLAVIAALPCLLLLTSCDMRDQAGRYPDRPITLIVPFTPGGGTDTYARIFKKAIEDEELLPQPLVIVNIDGAGATIGSRRAKNASPDGYTMLVLHDAILTAKAAGRVNYGPEAFLPIAGTGEVGLVVTVRDDSPYQNLLDLMEAAKAQPDSVTFSANLGAITEYAGLQLEREFPGAQFRFIQSGGGAKRFADLKGNHVQLTAFSLEEFVRFRSDGLRGLAYFGVQRSPAAPDVPTAREQGLDVVTSNTFYWWVPKGTPQDRIDVLGSALRRALETDYVQAKHEEIHCESFFIQGQELEERLKRAEADYAKVSPRQPTELPNIPLVVLTATLTTLLGAVVLARYRPGSRPGPVAAEAQTGTRAILAVACLALTVTYVAVLDFSSVGFVWATIVFLILNCAMLSRFNLKVLAAYSLVAIPLVLGIYFLFTHYLEVRLPGSVG
jgi:tripartite-type tricarboxylate transporter receptor subunit TctC